MDNIAKLLAEIREDGRIRSLRPKQGFSRKFLENVGDIFETHGFGTTEVYLQAQEAKNRPEAKALLYLLKKFRYFPEIVNNRAIGRYIIKILDTLFKQGEKS